MVAMPKGAGARDRGARAWHAVNRDAPPRVSLRTTRADCAFVSAQE